MTCPTSSNSTPEHDPHNSAVLIDHPDRSRGDMCPGALNLHKATDGSIGRVRFPGGWVRPKQWEAIARIARTLGDGTIHITTRGNMQFRGVEDVDAFAAAVEEAGFLPSKAHDKIRNIMVSALHPELVDYAHALDEALLATEKTAGLSGRTLFGFDAGVGDITAKRPDFGVFFHEDAAHLLLAGEPTGLATDPEPTVVAAVLTQAAAAWQQRREANWRMHEAPEVVAGIAEQLKAHEQVREAQAPAIPAAPDKPIGWIENGTGVTLGAGLRFGFFSAQVADMLAAIGAPVTITPWASLVIHNLKEEEAEAVVCVLAPLGLIFDANSDWLRVTACTGLPGCAKSLSNTQADATELVLSHEVPEGLVHFSGCGRRCGHPIGPHTEYVATGDGEYEVATR